MHQFCFVCNARVGLALKNGVNLFGTDTLPSGQKLTKVLSEIVEKPINEPNAHAKIICKKCHKNIIEYDTKKMRLKVIQQDLITQFKNTLTRNSLNYDTYNTAGTPMRRRVVVPASQLQPVPPGFMLVHSKPMVSLPSSTLNLKVTVGSSVLTQSIKTTNPLSNKMITLSNTSTPSQNFILTPASTDDTHTNIAINPKLLQTNTEPVTYTTTPTVSCTSSTTTKTSNILSFNVNSLPKDFLSSGILSKVEVNELGIVSGTLKKEMENDLDTIDEDSMEIEEGCAIAVPAAPHTDDMTFANTSEQSDTDKTKDFLENFLSAEGSNDGGGNKFIVGKVEVLNERGHDDDGDEGQTIVMDGENGSIIRLVSGQKFLYGDSEISLVLPEDPLVSDNNDTGDGQDSKKNSDDDDDEEEPEQFAEEDSDSEYKPDSDDDDSDSVEDEDSNDESQIELQVSGDEETANAIIAAAKEQGGAFIKVESGEMYRVKSVSSKATDETVTVNAAVNTMVVREKDGRFRCLLCENRDEDPFYGDAEETMAHLKTMHSARAYLCNQCGRMLRKRSEYAAHIEQHALKANKTRGGDINKTHECDICLRKYSSRALLQAHMNFHNGSKPYICDICKKSFTSKYTLQSHLKTHVERPRPYKCKECPKTFLTPQNLLQHQKTHSGIKDFICNVCGKAFASQHNLEVHGVVHSGNKPFECGVCGKSFARRAEVRDHMRTHTGERPYKCDICGARFTQNSNLHSHRRATHLGDARHHCAHCPKKFKRRRLLDYHIKASHTGERPLKCEICKASFVYPEHYKKHIRIHSGEKPFVCEVCGKCFNSRDNRNTHRFVHSDRKPYECLVCGAGYMRKQLLYQHMNTSGHLAESIVVNQPRVMKVSTQNNGTEEAVVVQAENDKDTEYETVYEATGDLQLEGDNEKEGGDENTTTKLFITDDKKLIIQDGKSVNYVQEDSTLLTLQNIDTTLKADRTLLEGISSEQLEQAQLLTSDGTLRIVQIQLTDGNNGWLTINDQ